MSSRVLRKGTTVDAPPIAWRQASTPADHYHGGAQQPNRAAGNVDVAAEVERQVQARLAAAREQGRVDAENAAYQRAMDRFNPVIAAFEQMIAELSSQGRRLRGEAERDMVKLAVAIARRILRREIAVDPEVVLGLVKAAFARVEARETHRLRVSPTDAALLREHRQDLNLPAEIEIVPDGALPEGSVIFETARGDLDASIDTQLGEIERGLADIVRRRLP
jgi:flagellar assembly protein FliH